VHFDASHFLLVWGRGRFRAERLAGDYVESPGVPCLGGSNIFCVMSAASGSPTSIAPPHHRRGDERRQYSCVRRSKRKEWDNQQWPWRHANQFDWC